MKAIKNKWESAAKIKGFANVVTLADGSVLNGNYYLCESGSVTPSHDPFNGFCMSPGFPTDENGNTVNDRDYFGDKDAQRVTEDIARNYDSRAIQTPVIISADGIVLSGNGRTIAGNIAAKDGTDAKYINHLAQYGMQFGFNAEAVCKMEHPRLVFCLSDALPYTPETFARFNAQDMKSQNKTERAIKYGKLVKDSQFNKIVAIINAFETLADFYANTDASVRCFHILQEAGVINALQFAQLVDGDTISAEGREVLENVLIGKAFAANPNAARQITTYKSVRKSVIFALGEISHNLTFSEKYTLSEEIAKAVHLVYDARNAGYKDGEKVSVFACQMDIFGGTVSDFRNTIIMTLADVLNDARTTQFKKYLSVYNKSAANADSGQIDIFSGIETKEQILQKVNALFTEGNAKEQKDAIKDATKERTENNIFVSTEQLQNVVKGSFVEYTTKNGDKIICQVEKVINTIAYLIAKGSTKLWANVSALTVSASHVLNLPSWIKEGETLTNGEVVQKVSAVTEKYVIFEWINGGYFDVQIKDILNNWKPCAA